MRIISGTYGGLRFNPNIDGKITRPTTDQAKESLFNILQNRINFEEIKFLELFAGTGNISFEMLSRGVNDVTCVEMNRKCNQCINEMTLRLKITKGIKVIKKEVIKFLKKDINKYHVIFADPPYNYDRNDELLNLVGLRILEKGMFILEHDSKNDYSKHINFLFERKYGTTIFSFFQY